jgi:hypothetical protein
MLATPSKAPVRQWATIVLLAVSTPLSACPFCSNLGKTLNENVAEANLVVYAKLENARQSTEGTPTEQTDMTVLEVIKDNPVLAGKKKFVLPRYIAGAEKEPVQYLVFAEVVDGKIDPYRGMPVDSQELVKYLASSVRLAKAKPTEKLAFFFENLDSKNAEISGDAYKEFAAAPYRDVVLAAPGYNPEKLVGWIKDKETPSYRLGLYGCLLGSCGRPQDAKLLRDLVANPDTRPLTGVDGLLGGYCILDPVEGPKFVLGVLADAKNDFNFRYAALRTVRFLLTEIPNIQRQPIYDQLVKSIAVPDSADLVIDELRKHKVWSALPQVLAIYGKDEFDLQVVRRAVIRFAIKCPDPKAAAFVAGLRKQDPQLIADVEEILRFEETQEAEALSKTATEKPASDSAKLTK